jgi:rhodanese-related sulfurtransferase
MAQNHSRRFLDIVNSVRPQIRECRVHDVIDRRAGGEAFHLVDVREESEFSASHIPQAIHLGKGVIERDIESAIPDTDAPIVLYCGGGFRSALAALNLQQMGYANVISMDGGFSGWKAASQPVV